MKIPIQNIYYLLCYSWDSLEEGAIISVSQDDCKTIVDLFARVLNTGVTHLLKRGLDRGYIVVEEDTSSLRGKMDTSITLKRNLLRQCRVHCAFDVLSYDVLHNRIIKTTLQRLIRCRDVDRDLRDRLLRLYRRMHEVADIELKATHFGKVQLHRNNAYYKFLLQVCRLVFDNLLLNEKTSEFRFRDFLRDERQMASLFEKFVRNFYRREQREYSVGTENIEWHNVEARYEDRLLLPGMKTDISLTGNSRKIVIDTKYYASCLQSHWGRETVHSNNLYQLFAYLNNLRFQESRALEGILLYPTVDRSLSLRYRIQGNTIRVETIDLNTDWRNIRQRLLNLLQPIPSTEATTVMA